VFTYEVGVADGCEFSVQVLVEGRVHVGGRQWKHRIVVHRCKMNSIINESNNIYCVHLNISRPTRIPFRPSLFLGIRLSVN
jgi:hypothetical protein